MAGLYIHIPFCKQACHYCNFHFSTSLAYKNDFIGALLNEIILRKDYLAGEKIETIYFGGGTPSVLESPDINQVMDAIFSNFSVDETAEITLEANPDDIGPATLKSWRDGGINRLSIGVQSFFDEDLLWMNRVHDAGQASLSIDYAFEAGFSNISIDLIYGSPTTSDIHWEKNVERAIRAGIPHLSCYALTVEPKTPLNKMIRQHKKENIDQDHQARQFLLLMDWMASAKYEHYEISNFALPGKRSRHNSAYWLGKKYLGLGPSSHSYNGISRQWNLPNNQLYIHSIAGKQLAFEIESLTCIQRLNEIIMTSVRTSEGISLESISAQFGEAAGKRILSNAATYVKANKLVIEGASLRLSREGKLLADGIAADLFLGPEDAALIPSDDRSPDAVRGNSV
jgi:oxygen-independent coproporphyrinogen III oxidase